MKFVKTLLAITIAICVMLSCITVPFAAVDCNTTAKTLVDYTSGNLPLAATTGDIPAKTLTVVDTTVADPAAPAGDKALWFANTDGNGTILSGRGVEVITLTNDAGLSKHVSFDFYVPEAAFYGNIRSAFSRYASNSLTTKNVGFFNGIEFNSAEKADGYVTQVNFKDNGTTIAGTAHLPNGQWHTIDMFINERETDFYADGVYYGSVEGAEEANFQEGSSYGFLGFQLLPGHNSSAIYNNLPNAGIYLDNIKVKKYNTSDVKFCGVAEQIGKIIKVYFTEPVKDGQSLENIKLYNTSAGSAVGETTVALDDDVMTLTIRDTNVLARGDEYMIDFPDDFESITGKKLYADVYFKANSYHPSNVMDFEDYTADVETIKNGVLTALVSSQGNVTRKDNLQIAKAGWMNAGLLGIKDFSNMYSDRGNVVAIRYNEASGRQGEIRSGITILAGNENLSQNTVAMEFDMMIPDRSKLDYFYFGPYSLANGISASGGEVNHSGLKDGAFGGANTQYAHILAPDQHNVSFNSHKEGTIAHRGSRTDSDANYDHSAAYTNGEWCKVRIDIKKTGDNAYETKFWLDGELVSTVTGMSQADRTDTVRGLRFTYQPASWAELTDLVYIDNFKVSKTPDMAMVSKVRLYNPDGEEFGMLTNKVKSTAPKADIFFNGEVDATAAVVTLTEGENTITSKITPDASANKITATFDKLMTPSTEYTITVSGLKKATGEALDDYTAKFTTSDDTGFEITLELTDAQGNVIEDTMNLDLDDVVYVKSSVVNNSGVPVTITYSAATYSSDVLSDVGAKNFTVESGKTFTLDKDSEIPVSATVKALEGIEVGGFAWNASNLKPLIEAVKY